MSFRRNGFLHRLLMIMFAIAAFEGAACAQFTVNITGPGFTSTTAPSGQFNVSAAITGNANPIAKVVFYRNDVPYKTVTSSPFQLSQNQLGQDTYTYRARAYDSAGTWVDSSDVKLTVHTPRVVTMGDLIGSTQTHGPNQTVDHTLEIQAAVDYLGGLEDGGTLFFPCKFPTGQSIGVYNIKNTITIPSNVTLQGEGAEAFGRCRFYWFDVDNQGGACADNPGTLLNKPMFKLAGDAVRVRFKDMWLWSLSAGIGCWPRSDWQRIAVENNVGIEMSAASSNNIRDVIIENVAISNFTYGIRATSDLATTSEISDIKIRAYRPTGNHRQLYINAKYAYNWDVQNLNITGMMETQGAVEIVNAGKPASPVGENTKLKFLQVNCNASHLSPPAFCMRVEKHGGLYIRQLHHEGTNQALIVEDISGRPATNPDPIVFESSTGTGTFNDAGMKLYLIGNNIFAAPEIAQAGFDTGRLRFVGAGVNSTVIDCGDIHWDITDTNDDPNQTDPPPPPIFGMYYSHTERNRASFFAEDSNGNKFTKAHTPCPQGVAGLPNVNEIGGEYFDSGLIPTEVGTYSHELSTATCDSQCIPATKLAQLLDLGGTVYVKNSFTLTSTVTIRSGSQIVGAPDATLTLDANNTNLFLINAPVGSNALPRTSGIVIRDLKLKTIRSGNTGVAIVGDANGVGVSSDLHFSGLTIEGFENGFYARPASVDPIGHQPMIDGLSLKNNTFISNQWAVRILSANASNWNVMNLRITSDDTDAIGWDQKGGGHQSLQNITCQGSSSHPMSNCIRLSMTGTYLAGVKPTNYVTNGLTVFDSMLTYFVIRDSDFRSARMNITGRAFIVSMNNKYDDFNVDWTYSDGDLWHGKNSRLTYCGDTYAGGVYSGSSNGLATTHPNLIVGVPTLTRVPCGTRPIPWDDVVRWGGEANDKPLVGNFFDNVREDFVIYRPGSQSYFFIKQAGGVGTVTIPWGQSDDIPLIGRFYPDSRAQIVIWRPSSGDFWVHDPRLFAPNTATNYAFHWGQSGDIPFVGNFFDEYGPGGENNDEVGIYRPSDRTIWIANPRSGEYLGMGRSADYGTNIQIGDFRGVGYDQIAQFQAGVWNIIDTRTAQTYALNLGQSGDVPVAGKYLTGACTQLGVWRPGTQEFIVADPFSSCGTRSTSMIWGSNNDNGSTPYTDDIPLTINTADGSLRRPTSYRPTKGAFEFSLSNGQWWVHDPF